MSTEAAVRGPARSSAQLGAALFVVWGPPSHGPRSRVLARKLGIGVHFLASLPRRGLATAPLRYAHQAAMTLRLLLRRRPTIVFVQSPPSLAVLVVWLWCALTGSRFVVDAHSGAMQEMWWTRPRWLHRMLSRRAVTTIVTNEHFARRIRGWGAHALVVRDVPTTFQTGEPFTVEGDFAVLVVSTFAPDEPLGEIFEAARRLPDVVFYVTGDPARAGHRMPADLPGNVRLTGFLPDDRYYALMAASQAVMCLTTRDHTMQRGACEALSMGTPIITSKWPLLQQYFSRGTVHVGSTASEIREGVAEMRRGHARYVADIEALRSAQRDEWAAALDALLAVLVGSPQDSARARSGSWHE